MADSLTNERRLREDLEAARRALRVEEALERVRARALGMQSSDEIPDVVRTLFEQITGLGFPLLRAGILFLSREEGCVWWSTSVAGEILSRATFTLEDWRGFPPGEQVYQTWLEGEPVCRFVIKDDALSQAVEYVKRRLGVVFPEYETSPGTIDTVYSVWTRFEDGMLFLPMREEVSDENATVLERFADVFGFAYSRMQEIEKAEREARMAERRAAVDHIRAEIAAMRNVEDFERVTPLLWQTLTVLGVPFLRCGFTIHDRETEQILMYLSDHAGNPMAALKVPRDRHPYLQASWDRWSEGEVLVHPFSRDEFVALQLAIQTGLQSLSGDRYVDPESLPERLVAHTVPFSHGTLYVNSPAPLSQEDLAFVADLAGAFSVAYARYQDFQRLERQNVALEEASRIKSRFLATMSHELRTPMNAIIGFTQLVLRRGAEGLPERHRQNLEKVKQSADHLLALINDILDLSKIEARRMDIRATHFDVDQLIASCCATVSPLVKSEVALRYGQGEKVGLAETDQDRLRQVLINLLSNALKFTDRGEVTVSARGVMAAGSDQLTVAGTGGPWLEIAVSDTGIGIPGDRLQVVFEEFSQVPTAGRSAIQGTGLGLSICRSLTELMGGTISVESREGEGSVFTVRIPRSYAGGRGAGEQGGEAEQASGGGGEQAWKGRE